MEYSLTKGRQRAVADTVGGELVSYQDGAGLEYIWQGDPAYWAGRNPLLFPNIGALAPGGTVFEGKRYPLERHGFARHRQFALAGRGEDWVELVLHSDGESLAVYPFPFVLRVRHSLGERGFSTAITVENSGDAPMPFCLGGHTAFRCPLVPGEDFEAYELHFEQPERCATLVPEGGFLDRGRTRPWLEDTDHFPLRYRDFDEMDTLVLEGLRSRWVTLRHPDSGRGVRMECSDFPVLALWSMPHKRAPYLCIEPWHGCPHVAGEGAEFAEKTRCITLMPGQARTLGYTVECLQGKRP